MLVCKFLEGTAGTPRPGQKELCSESFFFRFMSASSNEKAAWLSSQQRSNLIGELVEIARICRRTLSAWKQLRSADHFPFAAIQMSRLIQKRISQLPKSQRIFESAAFVKRKNYYGQDMGTQVGWLGRESLTI
jgi:hypothetical protein